MAATTMVGPVGSPSRLAVTYEQFLSGDADAHAEWVNGVVIEKSPVSEVHTRLCRFLIQVIGAFVQARGLGEVFFDPFQMKAGPDLPGRAPDLMFVSHARMARLRHTHLEGPADLAVEIVSEGSRAVDRGEKFYEYEKGGVGEYWLLDPERRQAEFYQLSTKGIYEPVQVGADEHYSSSAIDGLIIKAEWLWDQPPVLTALREIGLL